MEISCDTMRCTTNTISHVVLQWNVVGSYNISDPQLGIVEYTLRKIKIEHGDLMPFAVLSFKNGDFP